MEDSPHVMLSGAGADQFSREQGLEQAPPEYFATPERRRQLEEMKAKKISWFDVDLKYGTVGAVAPDSEGHVAAATSTGGLNGTRWARMGEIGRAARRDRVCQYVSILGAPVTLKQ